MNGIENANKSLNNSIDCLKTYNTTAYASITGRWKWSIPVLGALTAIFLGWSAIAVDKAVPLGTFAKLPIKELTVFKDGHAFVAHEGELPTDEHGNVLMDRLPTPVIGTFWPYSADPRANLTSVVAGQQRVKIDRTALNLRELLEANIGAEVIISETGTNRYEAIIVDVPQRSTEEKALSNPPNSSESLPEKGNLILLKTADGVKGISIDRIQEVTFKSNHQPIVSNEEFRNLLTLKLNWGHAKPEKVAKVGLFYLQKGVRWIPSYKIEIDGKGNAKVKIQATLINELADLENASVDLVVGVPTFAFKETLDPMALQQSIVNLSQYFQTDTGSRNSPLAYQFSNAIMSQSIRAAEYRSTPEAPASGSLGPEIGDAEKSEDLFVFNVRGVTLRKGERMVHSIADLVLPYKDIFTLELPFAPPPELRGNLNTEQQRELARLFNAPKVMHKIRLTNNSKYPMTTAPALLLREGRLLAQNLLTYASTGVTVDLTITTAVDFQVKKSDLETKRSPNAVQENGNSYSRIDLAGKIIITNPHSQPAEIEVTRYVLGTGDNANHDGKIEKMNAFENGEFISSGDSPYCWNWYSWPNWWSYFNGTGRISWKLKLDPDQNTELDYDWHYFWR